MKRTLKTSVFVLSFLLSLGNDGAFRSQGNHLVPINESDISIQKEILKVIRFECNDSTSESGNCVLVDVYYEFFNPGIEKELLVGFEAASPAGDAMGSTEDGRHPYMRDFSVVMNNSKLRYDVALVDLEHYDETNNVNTTITPSELEAESYLFVYHFNAVFKPGVNIVRHRYVYEMSSGVDSDYSFSYLLSTAGRWAGGKIDDFNLIIDMGENQNYRISKTFFNSASQWEVNEESLLEVKDSADYNGSEMRCLVTNGYITFHQDAFVPRGELGIISYSAWVRSAIDTFNANDRNLPQDFTLVSTYFQRPTNQFSKDVLRNMPFARRGYVFRNEELKAYFSKQPWYTPDPYYRGRLEGLSKEEQDWVARWK